MTWSNRVVWLEGMFLRAQHFQQQDRWLEALVRDRTASLRPHGWGLTEAAINRNLLGTGQFALASGSGVFEDGTPFALPGETDQPVPLDLPETTRNAVVYLVLPMRQAGSVEVSANGSAEGRYEQRGFEAYDTHSGSPQPADVQIGRLRLRYMLESENRAGYHGIGLARVVEVEALVDPAVEDGGQRDRVGVGAVECGDARDPTRQHGLDLRRQRLLARRFERREVQQRFVDPVRVEIGEIAVHLCVGLQ